MTIRTRRPSTDWPQLPLATPAQLTARAKRLDTFQPGVAISVPLMLLPEYLRLYSLAPLEPGQVIDLETNARIRKPAGVLWVQRSTEGKKP